MNGMTLTSRTKPPRHGLWRFTHPVSGTVFTSPQLGAIKASIWKHEESNSYPPSSEKEIEDQLCRNHPFSCSEAPPSEPHTRKLHLVDILRGTQVIAAFKLAGSPLVSQEEANRRAGICSACPKNVDYQKPCGGVCEELIKIVQSVVGGAATPFDPQLKACEICGCANIVQVHVPAEILAKGVSDAMWSDFRQVENCWKWKSIEDATASRGPAL